MQKETKDLILKRPLLTYSLVVFVGVLLAYTSSLDSYIKQLYFYGSAFLTGYICYHLALKHKRGEKGWAVFGFIVGAINILTLIPLFGFFPIYLLERMGLDKERAKEIEKEKKN